jgi:hypothetical protein
VPEMQDVPALLVTRSVLPDVLGDAESVMTAG